MSAAPALAETATTAVMECTACGSSMESRPNPYFGAGLATHRMIALCKGCYRVAFVPEPVQAEGASDDKSRLGNFARRLFARAA
jgi:hypothetical protein